ncbi:hypothetical protein Z042_07750 [Chania multitudinisentens RB-25]|uniref:Uncharacterized protein n=1 Tax=Chania multitudinisentens RB-25 TaxID=1441930 RepID=W0LFS2_9GAMM|nr:hypothetical protein Z042_07750 [Chania multitudinisentens RB-25]
MIKLQNKRITNIPLGMDIILFITLYLSDVLLTLSILNKLVIMVINNQAGYMFIDNGCREHLF